MEEKLFDERMTDNFQRSLMTIAIHSFKMLRKTRKDPQTPILKVKNKVKFFKDFFLKRTRPQLRADFLPDTIKKRKQQTISYHMQIFLKRKIKIFPQE